MATILDLIDQQANRGEADFDTRLKLTGIMASSAANLESLIETTLIGLLGSDQRYGGRAVRWISVTQQLSLIKDITKDRYGADSEVAKAMHESIYGKEGKGGIERSLKDRNEIVHAVYTKQGNEQYIELRKRSAFDINTSPFNIQELLDKVKGLLSEYDNFVEVIFKYELPYPPESWNEKQKQLARLLRQNQDHQQEGPPPPPEASQE